MIVQLTDAPPRIPRADQTEAVWPRSVNDVFMPSVLLSLCRSSTDARHLYFPNDLACVIHNADARLLDRNVQSSKMVHAALLLLMLEVVITVLVSPSA
jgi:hypothetical protein